MTLEGNKKDLLEKLDLKIQGDLDNEQEIEEMSVEDLQLKLNDMILELNEKKKEGDLYQLKFRDAVSFTSLGG